MSTPDKYGNATFHRPVGGPGRFQLWLINADGSGEIQLTKPPINGFPNWSEIPATKPTR